MAQAFRQCWAKHGQDARATLFSRYSYLACALAQKIGLELVGAFGHNTALNHHHNPTNFKGFAVVRILDQGNPMSFASETSTMEPESWDVDRRQDGAVLVRVHSTDRNGRRLPDAVFTFRLGDPQYNYWEEKFLNRSAGKG